MYTHPTAMRCRKQAIVLDQRKVLSRMGVARQSVMSRKTLYKWLGRHEEAPEDPVVLEDRERESAVMPNQTPLEWEMKILDYTREYPTQGAKIVSHELCTREIDPIPVGESAVRGVWRRNGLSTVKARLDWIEKQKPPEELTPWAADKEASKTRHLHAPHPGHIVCMDGKTIGGS